MLSQRGEIMAVILGGAGSSGSTLLRIILNRNSQIFAGSELSLFNKEDLFENWEKYKKRWNTERPLNTKGWFPYSGPKLLREDYGWNEKEVAALIDSSINLKDFVNIYFEKPLRATDKRIWVENTPSNIYCFAHFLRLFENGRVIHVARNPLDMAASYVRRGRDAFFSAGQWVYNNARGLPFLDHPKYMLVKYEELVNEPEEILKKICKFIGVSFESQMLESKGVSTHVRLPGWHNSATGKISRTSMNKYFNLKKDLQKEIETGLHMFSISRKHSRKYKLKYKTCGEICRVFGYNMPQLRTVAPFPIFKYFLKDIYKRSAMRLPTHVLNYPGSIFGVF